MDLIVTHGFSSGGSVKHALASRGLLPKILPCFEEFSIGPICPLSGPSDLDKLAALRARFCAPFSQKFEILGWKWRFGEDLAAFEAADGIEIWSGHGLQEQVFLFFLGAALRARIAAIPELRLVQFRSPDVAARLGHCETEILASPPPAIPVDAGMLDRWAAGWQAIAAPVPAAVNRLLAEGSGDALADRALLGYTARLPRPESGLDAFELLLLRHVGKDFGKAIQVIGFTLAAQGWHDIVGDLVLHHRLIQMARRDLPRPLLEYRGNRRRMAEMEVRLTPTAKPACRAARTPSPRTASTGGSGACTCPRRRARSGSGTAPGWCRAERPHRSPVSSSSPNRLAS